jgi:hypothetical protein
VFSILAIAMAAAFPAAAQTIPPAIVTTNGYINATPLTAHTTSVFNTTGATTLVAFVSTNTPWNGQPVSISGLTDNLNNTWNLLAGPTTSVGGTWTLVSAIYYVNAPTTSTAYTVTAKLSNPAPFVMHIFAISGADATVPPITSAIGDPGTGNKSAAVASAPIIVPANSLLLGWAKNETGANATATGGYTLDGQSTSYLWAESQAVLASGSYTSQFQYDGAVGWQTAVVGVKPSPAPVATNQSVSITYNTPVNITLTATSPKGAALTYTVVTGPSHGVLTGVAPNLTYTPNAGYLGNDAFTFKANDGNSDSNIATVTIAVRQPSPVVVSSVGYTQANPQKIHTSATFHTTGASMLVALVSSHPVWNGASVSFGGLTDNIGNTWKPLAGPTTWVGGTYTLMSEIYYVNAPTTSAAHTVTATLINPAPLVLHVFAVAGSDMTGAPVVSAITSPAAGQTSVAVASAPITVPSNSLLLAWVKNENGATATATGGYALDPQSVGFLWGESQAASAAGSYRSQFQYASSIGWQTAVVGVTSAGNMVAPPVPTITSSPANPTNQTSAGFSFSDTQADVTFVCQLDGRAFSSCTSPTTYASPLGQGSHTFAVKAQDSSGNQSSAASSTWTIDTTAPPAPTITSKPANPTNQTSASFSFNDTEAGVSFVCQLDTSASAGCTSPATHAGPLAQGSHTLSVTARDAAGNQGAAATFTWTIDTTPPPTPTVTSTPANPTNQTSASFSFSDTEAGVSFICQLDTSAFAACTRPASYSGLGQGTHTFSVKARDASGNLSTAAPYIWTIDTTAPPKPTIISAPANPTKQTSATFAFSDTDAGVTYICQLDTRAFAVCSNPTTYAGPLSAGSHQFVVRAQDAAGNLSGNVKYSWEIDTTPPPTPAITSKPANPTTQTSASFSFADSQKVVTFVCQLDGSGFTACSSPKSYAGLSKSGSHTFAVEAQDSAGNLSSPATYTWTIN